MWLNLKVLNIRLAQWLKKIIGLVDAQWFQLKRPDESIKYTTRLVDDRLGRLTKYIWFYLAKIGTSVWRRWVGVGVGRGWVCGCGCGCGWGWGETRRLLISSQHKSNRPGTSSHVLSIWKFKQDLPQDFRNLGNGFTRPGPVCLGVGSGWLNERQDIIQGLGRVVKTDIGGQGLGRVVSLI